MTDFLYRLFFTKDEELDLGWLLLLIGFLNGVVIFNLAALGLAQVTIAAWSWYGAVISMCFIAGTTISRARLIANSKTIGEVVKGIASAHNVETSTDIQEISQRFPSHPDDIG